PGGAGREPRPDSERFAEEMQARRHRQRVQADTARARHDGADRTPTFFINGVHHAGDSDRDSLEAAMREAMKR
ncbi:DsbA family protein, partial [Enterococcus faecium]|uniref:DsbA family protein n=1 Tax=Enterococcus faecium TaxID=1352 RepID=UPI003D9FDD62